MVGFLPRKEKIMDLKFNRKLRGRYDTKIVSYENIDNNKGGYCKLVVSTPIRKEYDIVIFPSQLNYWANNLADIAGLDTEDFEEVLNKLIEEQTVFPLYYGVVSYSTEGKRYNNGVSFYEPEISEVEEEITSIV